MLIYVSGPLSNGTGRCLYSNVVAAVEIAEQLYERGHHTIVPHLTAFQDRIIRRLRPGHEQPYKRWLDLDFDLIRHCDALYFMGPSPGATRELEYACRIGKLVFHKMGDVPWLV